MNSSSHVQSPLVNAHANQVARPSWFWPVLAFLVGGIYVYAGVLKAWDPPHFANDVLNYRLISYPLAIRVAFYLPWLEILCGLAVIVGWLRSGAVAILTLLTVFFIAITIAAKLRGISIDCGCFGAIGRGMSFTSHMLIDGAILAGLIALWFRSSRT